MLCREDCFSAHSSVPHHWQALGHGLLCGPHRPILIRHFHAPCVNIPVCCIQPCNPCRCPGGQHRGVLAAGCGCGHWRPYKTVAAAATAAAAAGSLQSISSDIECCTCTVWRAGPYACSTASVLCWPGQHAALPGSSRCMVSTHDNTGLCAHPAWTTGTAVAKHFIRP
jgi:hypothetical protein